MRDPSGGEAFRLLDATNANADVDISSTGKYLIVECQCC